MVPNNQGLPVMGLSAKDAVFNTRTFFVSFIANKDLVIIAFIHNLQVNLRNKICNLKSSVTFSKIDFLSLTEENSVLEEEQ